MATPVGDAIPLSGTAAIDALVQGGRWTFAGAPVLSYSFSLETELGFDWTPELQDAARRALGAWSAVADLSFQEVAPGSDVDTSPADLALVPTGNTLQLVFGAAGLGVFPDPEAADVISASVDSTRAEYPHPEGDIYFDHFAPAFDYLQPGGLGFAVLLHETGHALGLKHQTDDGLNGRPTAAATPGTTVMQLGASLLDSGNGGTPLLDDIRAIQHIYGANLSYHTGNNSYALLPGVRYAIWDAGGSDTLNVSAAAGGLVFELAEGTLIQSGAASAVAIAYGVTIEHAIGSAFNDRITGNAAGNRLEGRDGADTLDGGAGNDTLLGGAGSDRYLLRDAGDVLAEAAVTGVDTIDARIALALLPANFENLELNLAGNLEATGNALANRITANDGDNRLDGAAGADTLVGGAGNDVYVVDSSADVIIDSAGIDRVESGASYSLAGGATLKDAAALPGFVPVNLTGNGLDNALTGNSGANLLDGAAGNDTLMGGAGDDTYVVDSVGDVPSEAGGGGTDTVITPFTTVLAGSFENLSLSGTGNVDATGNSARNLLRGNAGNNVLTGAGGLDSMEGGAGNDTYVIDRVLEQGLIVDGAGSSDTLISNVSYTSLRPGLENLTMTGTAKTGLGNDAANRITGNTGANILIGGAGNDTLAGGGGADLLDGGAGADRFLFDTAPAKRNVDFIMDFSAAAGDRIVLDNDIYAALGSPGALSPALFGDRILLDSGGALYYDADGAGGAAAVQFAILATPAGVGAASFEVVD